MNFNLLEVGGDSVSSVVLIDLLLFYRAMAGGTTIAENYAFAGMHHIFDQHTKAGKI